MLELAFDTKPLRQICENEGKAKRKLGITVAEKLKRRLADLRAATVVGDIVAGGPHEIEGTDHQHLEIDLSEGYRIVFCANHNVIPMLESGGVNWSRVSRIKILRIEDCHD